MKYVSTAIPDALSVKGIFTVVSPILSSVKRGVGESHAFPEIFFVARGRHTVEVDGFEFCERLDEMGVATVICTDISKDGAMQGTNHELYKELSERFSIDVIASGGVSSIEDIKRLTAQNLYGAIIGKAYYTGAIDLSTAIEVAK